MRTERPAFTIWFTGLSGAGKSTLAALVERALVSRGRAVERLDGDTVRQHLSAGLGFTREDRDANVRRIAWVCELLNRHGVIAVVAAIAPYRAAREQVRSQVGAERLVEVYVECSLETLITRDPKGLYRRALAGEIPHFTGVSDPYEAPLTPDVVCRTDGGETPEQLAGRVLGVLEDRRLLDPDPTPGSEQFRAASTAIASTAASAAGVKADEG